MDAVELGFDKNEDDIVDRLRDWSEIIDQAQGVAIVTMLSGYIFAEAADEIEHIRNTSNGWQAQAAGIIEDLSNAEDKIEELRHQLDRIQAALDDIAHLTTDHNILHRIKEARRG